jgi:hypothetical protein
MRLFLGMMQKANLMAEEKAPDPAIIEAQKEAEKNFTPNRAQRRAHARQRIDQRWDKKLANIYGIPKVFRGYSKHYGSSTEMMLSELLQQGAIKYKEMADGTTSTTNS